MTSAPGFRRYRGWHVVAPRTGWSHVAGESPVGLACRLERGSLGCGRVLVSVGGLVTRRRRVVPWRSGRVLRCRMGGSTACRWLMPSHLAPGDQFCLSGRLVLQMDCPHAVALLVIGNERGCAQGVEDSPRRFARRIVPRQQLGLPETIRRSLMGGRLAGQVGSVSEENCSATVCPGLRGDKNTHSHSGEILIHFWGSGASKIGSRGEADMLRDTR